jgi:hypothetical protein
MLENDDEGSGRGQFQGNISELAGDTEKGIYKEMNV